MMWRAAVLLVTLALARVSAFAYPGAPVDIDTNTPEVRDALKFAVDEFNKQKNYTYTFTVGTVIKAQMQVVSGFKYIFEVEMVRAYCKKDGKVKLGDKSDNQKHTTYACVFEIISQPWLGPPKLTKNVCKLKSS
ncbi:hypothetical protein ACEWY4_021065 [Coilia grayii]|uniref:Cystatin domain-containing protein n=1 Tax=Coilia grayii TaxID=363190 RepID=A0ABD1J826_9TELE